MAVMIVLLCVVAYRLKEAEDFGLIDSEAGRGTMDLLRETAEREVRGRWWGACCELVAGGGWGGWWGACCACGFIRIYPCLHRQKLEKEMRRTKVSTTPTRAMGPGRDRAGATEGQEARGPEGVPPAPNLRV